MSVKLIVGTAAIDKAIASIKNRDVNISTSRYALFGITYNRLYALALLAEGAACGASGMDTEGRHDFIAMYRMGGPL